MAAYKVKAPLPVAEGGTSQITLTNHGVLIGAGTTGITQLAAASTGQTLMGSTGADPSFTGSPSFSGSITAGTGLTLSAGNINIPTTTASIADGAILQNGTRILHTYGSANLFIGTNAGNGNVGIGSFNQGIGPNVMSFITTGSNNCALGVSALNNLTSGQYNVAVGNGTLGQVTGTNQNTAVGANALNKTIGYHNVGIGFNAGQSLTTGQQNTFIGSTTGTAYTTNESNNICIGYNVTGTLGESNTTRIGNGQTTAFIAGNVTGSTGLTATTGNVTATSGNVIITAGNLTLPSTTTTTGQITMNGNRYIHSYNSSTNIFIGQNCGNLTNTGTGNTGIGSGGSNPCFAALTTGSGNTGVGQQTFNALTSGNNNVAVGGNTLISLTQGSSNICMGINSGDNITTGNNNTFYGYQSGHSHSTSDSSNIAIGYTAVGVAGQSNRLQIGNGTGTAAGNLNKSFIHGIRGITTTNNDAIAVLIDSAGQLGTVSSSIRFKENVQDLGDTPVLQLRPVSFNFKQDGRPAIGLIAEEVEKVMPSLVAYNQEGQAESVKYHDLPVLLLAEIQKLRKEIDELKRR